MAKKVTVKKTKPKKGKKLVAKKKKTTPKKKGKVKSTKKKTKPAKKKKTVAKPKKTKPKKEKALTKKQRTKLVTKALKGIPGADTHKFNAYSPTAGKSYIINNSTKKVMLFQYAPESVPYSRGANYSTIQSPGMSYPLTQYTGGNVREFSVELFYYDKPYTGKIDEARKFLEDLLPPEKNSKTFKRPPTFTIAYGYFVRTGVLTNLDVTDDWLNEDGKPIMTHFTLTIRQVGK